MIKDCDTNGDGEIDFDEFKEKPSEGYVRRNRPGTTKNVSWVLC